MAAGWARCEATTQLASHCCCRDKSFEGKTQCSGCQDPQRLGGIWQGRHAEQVVQSGARQGGGAGISWTQGRGGRRDPNRVRRARHPLLFSCSVVSDSATPWTAARQASLSFTTSRSLLKLMSIESVMPSNHLILCLPLLLLPSVFPSIRAFSSESALAHVRCLINAFGWTY